MADIPVPPTFGLVLAGGLARRMGGGDKARIEIGGMSILDRVLATPVGAMRRHHHQRQWRSRALRRHRLHRRARQRAGLRRPARRHPRRARLAGRAEQRHRMAAQRAGRLPVPARRPGGTPAHRPRQNGRRRAARLRPLGRMAPPGGGPVAAGAARRACARRWSRRTCARSRSGRRATASRSPIGRPSRSTRSSTSTRRKTPSARQRIALQHQGL